MGQTTLSPRIAAVRRFNRFYTRQIGLLQETLLRSPFSLAEARVLYELAHYAPTNATAVGKELGLDAGYMSRILRGFEKRRLIDRNRSKTDGRQRLLRLTERGRRAFARLNRDSRREVGSLLQRLPQAGQQRLVGAMQAIEQLVGAPPAHPTPPLPPPYVLRPHQPADMGRIVPRHGAL